MTEKAKPDKARLTDAIGMLPDYAPEFRPRWPEDSGGFTGAQMRLYAMQAVAAERERCAQYLRNAADRLTPEGKRTNQVDRHVAHVLACKGDEIACGAHLGPTT